MQGIALYIWPPSFFLETISSVSWGNIQWKWNLSAFYFNWMWRSSTLTSYETRHHLVSALFLHPSSQSLPDAWNDFGGTQQALSLYVASTQSVLADFDLYFKLFDGKTMSLWDQSLDASMCLLRSVLCTVLFSTCHQVPSQQGTLLALKELPI